MKNIIAIALVFVAAFSGAAATPVPLQIAVEASWVLPDELMEQAKAQLVADCKQLGVPTPKLFIHVDTSPVVYYDRDPHSGTITWATLRGKYDLEKREIHVYLFLPLFEPTGKGEKLEAQSAASVLIALRHELLHHLDEVQGREAVRGDHAEAFFERMRELGWLPKK